MNPSSDHYALRARYVFPVDAAPLRGGVVVVRGGRIDAVLASPPGDCDCTDLGSAAIVPGLVNAHTHLDFSDHSVPIGRPGISLPDWIETVVVGRRRDSNSDSPSRLQAALAAGHAECLRSGVTTLGNIVRDADIPTLPAGDGIDHVAFLELLGLSDARVRTQMRRLDHWLPAAATAAQLQAGYYPGLSPHAPYTAHANLVAAACRASSSHRIPVAMHLAESREELELLARGEGPLVTVLSRLDAWDPTAIRRGSRPLDYLRMLGTAHRCLVIHGNYLDAEERAWLAEHSPHAAVVYCPRTHTYFGHEHYPLAEMLSVGVAVALGTDGRGSNPDLQLLEDMRHAARLHPEVNPSIILRLGTLAGAAALGCAGRVGSITPGKDANLAVVGLPDRENVDPHCLVLDSGAGVCRTIHRGRIVFDAGDSKGNA